LRRVTSSTSRAPPSTSAVRTARAPAPGAPPPPGPPPRRGRGGPARGGAPAPDVDPLPLEQAQKTGIIGVEARQPAAVQTDGIDRSDRPGFRGNIVQLRHHRLFIGDGDVDAPDAQQAHGVRQTAQSLRRHLKQLVSALDAQKLENQIVNVGGMAVRQLFSHQSEELHIADLRACFDGFYWPRLG
jgi:hypothetical protein